jgi:metal transporter CNNM
MEMKIKAQSGTPIEKEYAARVLPIISNHHLLLVTLMLWNACATEALPIFLDKMVPAFVAIIISVTLVLMFGEIIPASILTGPNQLRIAANLVPLVYVVMTIFFPLAYPISKLLDFIIGHEEGPTVYTRIELRTMMKMQHEEGQRHSTGHMRDTMHHDEATIIGGALTFRDTKVSQVMTLEKDAFMISINDQLSEKVCWVFIILAVLLMKSFLYA